MQVEHKMICCNMGKQKIARANHFYLNCKSVLESYEYVCASVSYLYDRMWMCVCVFVYEQACMCTSEADGESLEARLRFTRVWSDYAGLKRASSRMGKRKEGWAFNRSTDSNSAPTYSMNNPSWKSLQHNYVLSDPNFALLSCASRYKSTFRLLVLSCTGFFSFACAIHM